MSILDRDLAFSFPHLRRLQKLGIEAMELADQTAHSQEESMARIEGYLDELPPGIDTSELRQRLKFVVKSPFQFIRRPSTFCKTESIP